MVRPTTSAVLGAVLTGALALTSTAAVGDDGDTGPVPAPAGTGLPPERPVTTLELTTPDGEPVVVDGEAVAAPRSRATPFAVPDDDAAAVVLTEPLVTEEFYVAALTWDSGLAADVELLIRTRNGEEWTDWSALEADDEPPAESGETTPGSEPYIAAGATGVQVQVLGATAPAGLELHLIPANPANPANPADEDGADGAAAGVSPAAARAARPSAATTRTARPAAARPGVVSRPGWGANESLMTWEPENYALRAAVVHHTAGTNSYTAAQSPGIVRGIYHYHAVSRGWGDIGYNFLVDKYGQVFEGRSGSLASPPGQMPEGAHARSFNYGTLGISVLGDYSTLRAPQRVLDTMAGVIAWQFADAGLDAADTSGFTSPGTAARPAGQALRRIFAHRDVGATTCPGDNIYARIPALIRDVDERTATSPDDVVEYHLKNSLVGGPADLMFQLGLPGDDVLVGDWDGDGVDTLALRRGNEYHVYNSFRGGRADTVVRYGRADDVVLVGDWNGDGTDTFAVRRGREYHVKNSIAPGSADRLVVYGKTDDKVLVGDWDGDGTDTFAVRRGAEYHVRNAMAGGDADIAFHYGRSSDVVLVGDWDGDREDTFTVRRGSAYHVRNVMAGGDADTVFSYGRRDDVVLVGDWNGDRRDTLGVRRD
ncbi:N-acetylmuramoyl-L-alanine amidase [Georgenia sp. MJ173]|uniref:N-acetylmuramoyl-L-alanine amidase n=1 Tax=Georgenia sunbinii TaxID=3117728 RepID=UPI002F263D3B